MERIKIKWVISTLLLLFSIGSIANTVYAPNDIPLLDNRFRIDEHTEQVTVILKHPNTPQKVVLVQPDGSKLYQERHPKEKIGWLSTRHQDIVTITDPMPGPWQAIATLHGDSRIQLLNPIILHVDKLPLKVYQYEYLTTYAALMQEDKVISDKDLLRDAKLSVSLIGDTTQLVSLYKDDGQHYDSLPFDGKLTTHLYLDLVPGRYQLSIKSKNNIFVRSYNKEFVVFQPPLTYSIEQVPDAMDKIALTFSVNDNEIVPDSVIIEGLINNEQSGQGEQLIIHMSDQSLINNVLTIEKKLTYQEYHFTAKVFATTTDGRDISFQLPTLTFELIAPEVTSPSQPENENEANMMNEPTAEEASYLWLILTVLSIALIAFSFFLVYKFKLQPLQAAKKGKNSIAELSLDDFIAESTPAAKHEANDDKKQT